jgi:UDP-N-acetylmuramoyl-tripeptide--D-alanyl-D-alanine ligase
VRRWDAARVAEAADARLLAGAEVKAGPERVVIDSRQAGPGVLFVGLPGQNADGGAFAVAALAAGAWGVLVAPEHAAAAARDATAGSGVVLAAPDPLLALQTLARAWRRALRAQVIAVTGSTGKTSTKDLLAAILAPHRRTVASRANFNTEIGVPLEILSAPADTEVLVLEMAMRGAGQIAELGAIGEPDVGVIVNVGPVHLELLGSLEAIAAAKAELITALAPGATVIVPAGEPLLAPHLRSDLRTVTFGDGGDVSLLDAAAGRVVISHLGKTIALEVPFTQSHLRVNLLAAVAAAMAIGVRPTGTVALALSAGRGESVPLADGVTLLDDSYNANPMSMRAALDHLAATAGGTAATGGLASRRRVAVLGDMLELGPDERRFHAEIGAYARSVGVDVLVAVGPLAAEMAPAFGGEVHVLSDAAAAARRVPALVVPGDVVLVKASRGVGLELVCRALGESVAANG